ncbi:uncharacterized protein CMU_034930 [Cryptosporidium muris RN66]|uniref:Peptidase A1 domain-containing protein n=1 Tax=Cryptosporidium muris (strain RN66) TaxID=441375 RepID=B6AFW6_CRYMR|nr:uncharacterized protein CMU_034930 [Cryptosporidium muris RN66]EEA07107.1 hypothetical protein, conserved [Cryptosporidium muris RN66]|eukprot:XP_002141456.1 hypothetical protein [Cryptosporidium muris RN66]
MPYELIILVIVFIFSLDVLEIVQISAKDDSGVEFPPSWHFFENHYNFDDYKFGFTLPNTKKFYVKHNYKIDFNLVYFPLISREYELDQQISHFLSAPVQLEYFHTYERIVNSYRVKELSTYQRKFHICYRQPNTFKSASTVKLPLYTIELKFAGNLGKGKFLVNFNTVGLWVWSPDYTINSTVELKRVGADRIIYNSSTPEIDCIAEGSLKKINVSIEYLYSKINLSTINIEMPTVMVYSASPFLNSFLKNNRLDGILGIGNRVNPKSSYKIIQPPGLFPLIANYLGPKRHKFALTYNCNKPIENSNLQTLILNVANKDVILDYSNTRTNMSRYKIEVKIGNQTIQASNILFEINFSTNGTIIPVYRHKQILKFLSNIATRFGHTCTSKESFFGQVISCDCGIFKSQIAMTIEIKKNLFEKYTLDLRDFLLSEKKELFNSGSEINDFQTCELNIFSAKRYTKLYEKWIFGNVLCNSKDINLFSQDSYEEKWDIGYPVLLSYKDLICITLTDIITDLPPNLNSNEITTLIATVVLLVLLFICLRVCYHTGHHVRRRLSSRYASNMRPIITSPVRVSTINRVSSNESFHQNHSHTNYNR